MLGYGKAGCCRNLLILCQAQQEFAHQVAFGLLEVVDYKVSKKLWVLDE